MECGGKATAFLSGGIAAASLPIREDRRSWLDNLTSRPCYASVIPQIASQPVDPPHIGIIIAAAALPLIFLLALTVAKWVVEEKPFWETAVGVGWDMCILGVGLAAGLFADKEYIDHVGSQMAVFTTSSVLAVDLIFAFFILAMMKKKKYTAAFGTLAVILGVLTVSVPCVLLMWRWL